MKAMVKLAVLFATLLLVTGVAFAGGGCYYYEFSYTGLDDPTNSGQDCAYLCFDGNNSGTFEGFCESGDLSLFLDFLNPTLLLYSGDLNVEVGYLTFHGSWLNVFNGIIYCSPGGRYTVHGHKVDNCGA